MDYLSEYDPDWAGWFVEIAQFLRPRLADSVRIEHVGSTSVVGMVAKPIIDVDVVVTDGCLPETIAALGGAGYAHQGDLGVPGREAFQAVEEATRRLPAHHLYACEESSAELRRHVSLREYLRAHPGEAQRLAELKRRLAFQEKRSRSEYTTAKNPLMSELSALASAWYDSSTII